jgi:hypothetical protein
MQNQTPLPKPDTAEQPADEGLDETICSAFIVSGETRRINQEVRAENGEAEKRLRAVCQSEQRSRTSAISEYGDPREWDEPEKCIVCGDDEPCSHDFDKISWPNAESRRDDDKRPSI